MLERIAGTSVVAMVAMTGCGADQTCDVDVLAAARVSGVEARDCGDLVAEGDDHPELEEAHDCVQAALDGNEPFLVIWTFAGFEGNVSSAYVGRVDDGRLSVEQFQRAPDGGGNYSTSRRSCTALEPTSTCDSSLLRGFLCFECLDPSPPDIICSLAGVAGAGAAGR